MFHVKNLILAVALCASGMLGMFPTTHEDSAVRSLATIPGALDAGTVDWHALDTVSSAASVLEVWQESGAVVATIPYGEKPDLHVHARPGTRVIIVTPGKAARVWTLSVTDAGTWEVQR